MRKRSNGIAADDSTMIENSLEFAGSFKALACRQMRLTSHVDGVEGPEEPARSAQFIGSRQLAVSRSLSRCRRD